MTFHISWNVIISTDEVHHIFQRGMSTSHQPDILSTIINHHHEPSSLTIIMNHHHSGFRCRCSPKNTYSWIRGKPRRRSQATCRRSGHSGHRRPTGRSPHPVESCGWRLDGTPAGGGWLALQKWRFNKNIETWTMGNPFSSSQTLSLPDGLSGVNPL